MRVFVADAVILRFIPKRRQIVRTVTNHRDSVPLAFRGSVVKVAVDIEHSRVGHMRLRETQDPA